MSVPAPESLERARGLVEPAMSDALERLHPSLRLPIRYHLGWTDADGNPTAGGGGKGVRPALVVLSAEAAGAPAAVGIPGAVAIELIHNFSLLHDDVMDGDEERRHRRTVWAQYGIGRAVIAGDALVTLALRVLLDVGAAADAGAAGSGSSGADAGEARTTAAFGAVSTLVTATDDMITGQAVDLAFESRLDVTLPECIDMATGKTGALLGAASSIGAVLAGAPATVVDALESYGRHLGVAFQAVDDLLGIWGRPEVTGKPAWNDLRQEKKSIPIVFALTRDDEVSAELRALFAKGADRSEDDVARAAKLVERCGGRDLTESTAREHLELATQALDLVAIDPVAHAELVELGRFVTARDY